MNVFLLLPRSLNPKQTYREYPLGVGLIATALRRQGHEVAVFDQSAEGADDERLLARLRDFCADLVGLSVITPSYPVAQRQLRRLRREFPRMPIVAGGIHASLFPQDFLADGADAVVLGEGCAAMVELLRRLSRRRSWRDVPRVVSAAGGGLSQFSFGDRSRSQENGTVPLAGAAKGPDLAELGIVDRDVYNLPLYTHHSMLASRGCPYRCAFCANYTGRVLRGGVTIRSAGELCAEMRYLVDRYAAKEVFFVDDVFLMARRNVLEFCDRLVQECLDVQWVAQMRADSIDPQVAAAMVAAGCQRVYFGVESGSEAVLKRIQKGIDRETIRLGVRSAKDAGMRVKTGWVFGLPGTLDEQYESVSFMRELRPQEISIHQLIPFPGTLYYERPAEHGLRIRDPKDFASFCYGGLNDNISFDYLDRGQLLELLEHTVAALEAEGYVSSDRATPRDEYVFSTPLNSLSMSVFHQRD
ncbi:MAG: radical SAM protein [Thermoguttaceae bacterium]|jgi:radical SAM superfamily enzyme YgiQ (UPF0313 family)